ncbi:MAG: ubiquinol-cytochrome c reductase iron-sulfur subunit [Desulfobaccales bacterium]
MASILGLTGLGAFIYPLLRFLTPGEATARAKAITIAQSELPIDAVKDILVMGTPAIVIHTKDKGYIALSRVCTHLGCLVNYDKTKQIFICPCHAGSFDLEGNVISGPPPQPLPKFAVKVADGNIVIG